MAFTIHGSLDPHGAPVLRKEIITNSVTSVINDSVKLASGFIALGTAGVTVFGHLSGFATSKDVGVNTDGTAGAELGSFTSSYKAASDNQTVAKVKAECDVSKSTLYSAEVDSTIGTTTGSNLAGYRMDLVDANTLDESTAAVTTAQYNTWGTDPVDSARAIVNIFESQLFGL